MQNPRRMEWPPQSHTSFAANSGGFSWPGLTRDPSQKKSNGQRFGFWAEGVAEFKGQHTNPGNWALTCSEKHTGSSRFCAFNYLWLLKYSTLAKDSFSQETLLEEVVLILQFASDLSRDKIKHCRTNKFAESPKRIVSSYACLEPEHKGRLVASANVRKAKMHI